MLSWLPRQRARMERIEVEAETMIRDFGADAYFEARRREHESSSDAIAKDWDQMALAVARRVSKPVDVDPSIRVAMNAVLVSDRARRVRCARREFLRGLCRRKDRSASSTRSQSGSESNLLALRQIVDHRS
jgi:hypothetical protein